MDGDGVDLRRLPELAQFIEGETEVVTIEQRLGRRPTIVVGNSDGDLPMIRHALQGDVPRLAVLVNHDDDQRETASDRGAEDAIAAAPEGDNNLLVSMKDDFVAIWKP